jgi:hypothetical protein
MDAEMFMGTTQSPEFVEAALEYVKRVSGNEPARDA